KAFKNLSLNPDYLDIQILLFCKIASEKKGTLDGRKEWFDKTLRSFGNEFGDLFAQFDHYSEKMVRRSMMKHNFILFLIKLWFTHYIHKGVNAFKNMKIDLKFAKANEEVLSYSGMKLNAC